ncbi:KAP family NTPase [Aeromicrobium sp. CnD17-E]|nr:KAP family NTPase [Aeromicrobium sp. CnD17-E]
MALDIRSIDASEGYVVGLMGPWGSGKTSLVNLVKEQLRAEPALPVIDFNPWMFSGADGLVNSFFREISAQLREKRDRDYGALADRLDRYGEVLTPLVWLPVVGPWAGRVKTLTSTAKKFKDKNQKSAADQKRGLSESLAKLDKPIVVVVDDIDRLNRQEIQDVFKLVRLTASFPNIIYLLVFDRHRVEDALSEDGMPGRSYLEKIVQSGIDLPVVPGKLLLKQIGVALGGVVDDVGGVDRFDESRWTDVLFEVIVPLIDNMRDVRRYAASARTTVQTLKEKIDLVDLLALEAIRIFLPDVFRAVASAKAGLTTPSSYGGGGNYESPSLKAGVVAVIEAAGDDHEVAEALVHQLFPAGDRHLGKSVYGSDWLKIWLKGRRVAHSDVLSLYLDRYVTDSMAAHDRAEQAFALLSDGRALDHFLRSLPADEQEDVVAALETFEGDYPVEAVVPASVTLANLLSDLPEKERGMLGFDTRIVVTRVILRLLRRIDDEDAMKEAVEEIVPQLTSLSAKLEIVGTVGHVEGLGHKLVSSEYGAELEEALAAEIVQADEESLIGEWDLLRLLIAPDRLFADTTPRRISVDADPRFHEALVRSAMSNMRSQTLGSRQVHVPRTLAWDSLVRIYDGEPNLAVVLQKIDENATDTNAEVREVLRKYVDGWRPETFDYEDESSSALLA